MSDFENRLSALMHDVAPEPPRDLIRAELLEQPSGRRRNNVLGPLAAVVLVAVSALAVALVTAHRSDHSQSSPPMSSPTASPALRTPASLPPPSQVTAVDEGAAPKRIAGTGYPAIAGKVAIYVLGAPAQVSQARASFDVQIVLVNALGHPFTVPAAVCNGWLQAGLSSRQVPLTFADGGVMCRGISVPVGASVVTRRVSTHYGSCSNDLSTPPSADLPRCLPASQGVMPALPVGAYTLTLETSAIPSSIEPHPVTVTITGR